MPATPALVPPVALVEYPIRRRPGRYGCKRLPLVSECVQLRTGEIAWREPTARSYQHRFPHAHQRLVDGHSRWSAQDVGLQHREDDRVDADAQREDEDERDRGDRHPREVTAREGDVGGEGLDPSG